MRCCVTKSVSFVQHHSRLRLANAAYRHAAISSTHHSTYPTYAEGTVRCQSTSLSATGDIASLLTSRADSMAPQLASATQLLDEALLDATALDETLVQAAASAAIVLDDAKALGALLDKAGAQGLSISRSSLRKHFFTAERCKSKQCLELLQYNFVGRRPITGDNVRPRAHATAAIGHVVSTTTTAQQLPSQNVTLPFSQIQSLLGACPPATLAPGSVHAVLSKLFAAESLSLFLHPWYSTSVAALLANIHGDSRWLLPGVHLLREVLMSQVGMPHKADSKRPHVPKLRASVVPAATASCSALLQAFTSTCNFAGAASTWDVIRDFGLIPQTAAVNKWLSMLVDAKKFNESLVIGEKCISIGMAPDGFTLSVLLRACTGIEDFAKAQALWHQLTTGTPPHRPPVIPDVNAYNAYITVASVHGNHVDAIHVLDRMRRSGLVPTEATYAGIITSCSFADRPQIAFSLFDEMISSGLRPVEEVFYALSMVCSQHKSLEMAKECFELMKAYSFTPSERILSTLLFAAQQAGDFAFAYQWLQDLRTTKVVAATPSQDPFPYIAVLHGAAAQRDISAQILKSCKQIFEQLQEDAIPLTSPIIEALVRVFVLGGDMKEALSLLELAQSKDISLSADVYLPIIRCSGALQPDNAMEINAFLFEAMRAADVQTTPELYAAQAASAKDCKDVVAALATLDMCTAAGLTPTDTTFEHVLTAAVESNRVDVANTAVSKMNELGIKPSASILETITSAMRAEKDSTGPGRRSRIKLTGAHLPAAPTLAPPGELGRVIKRASKLRQHSVDDAAVDGLLHTEPLNEFVTPVRSFVDKPYQGGFALFPSVVASGVSGKQKIMSAGVSVSVPRGFRAKPEAEFRGRKLAGIMDDSNDDDIEQAEDLTGIYRLQQQIRSPRAQVRVRGRDGVVMDADNEAAALSLVGAPAPTAARAVKLKKAAEDVRKAAGLGVGEELAESEEEEASECEDEVDEAFDEEPKPRTKAFAKAYAQRMTSNIEASSEGILQTAARINASAAAPLSTKASRKVGALFGESPAAAAANKRGRPPRGTATPTDYHSMTYRRLEELFKERGISKAKTLSRIDLAARLLSYDEHVAKREPELAGMSIEALQEQLRKMNRRVVNGAAASNWRRKAVVDGKEPRRTALLAQLRAALVEDAIET